MNGKEKLPEVESAKFTMNPSKLRSSDNLIEAEEFDLEAVNLHSSRKKRALFTLATALLLVAFGLMVYYAWPSIPKVELVKFEFDEQTPSKPDENGQLFTNWIGTVSIQSLNNYDIGVKSIKIKAFIPSNLEVPVGFGGIDDILIKKKATSLLSVPFKVPVYQPSSGNPSLIEECMNKGKANLLIKAEIDLSITHWTGKKLTRTLTKEIDCSLPQLYKLIRSFKQI